MKFYVQPAIKKRYMCIYVGGWVCVYVEGCKEGIFYVYKIHLCVCAKTVSSVTPTTSYIKQKIESFSFFITRQNHNPLKKHKMVHPIWYSYIQYRNTQLQCTPNIYLFIHTTKNTYKDIAYPLGIVYIYGWLGVYICVCVVVPIFLMFR